jgi:hypothetical protein
VVDTNESNHLPLLPKAFGRSGTPPCLRRRIF